MKASQAVASVHHGKKLGGWLKPLATALARAGASPAAYSSCSKCGGGGSSIELVQSTTALA